MANYSVIIRASLDARGLRPGEREASSAFDRIAQSAEKASQREKAAFTSSSQARVNGELSVQRQLSAVASLQRQRSASLISDWKKQETAAKNLANGVQPLSHSLARLTDTMQALGGSTAALQGPMGGVASRLRSVGTLAAEAGGGLGLLGVGLGAVVVAAVAAGVAITKLVISSAEATGKFHDLSQQTGFSVETLSALGNAAETSGGSIETISGALGIFQKRMEAANEGNKQASHLFKTLSIDVNDNEKALRQAFAILSKLPAGAQATALSMQLFGRSGREVQGVFRETGGDLDKFMARLREMGVLISTDSAKKGDQLTDSITILGQRFAAVGRSIASEFAPLVSDALSQFSKWLSENQRQLIATAREVANLVKDISNLASFIYSISPVKLQIEIVRTIRTVIADFQGPGGVSVPAGSSLYDQFRDYMGRGPKPTGPGGALGRVDMSKVANQTADQIKATAKINNDAVKQAAAEAKKLQDALGRLGEGGGGGGGGKRGRDPAVTAKRIADLQLKAVLDGLRAEEEEITRSLGKRTITYAQYEETIQAFESKRNTAVLDGLNKELVAVGKMREPGARSVAMLEVENKFLEEKNRHTNEQNKLIDKTLSQTRERIRLGTTVEARLLSQTRQRIALSETLIAREAQDNALSDLEKDIARFRRQNTDDQLSQQRSLLAAKNEELDLLIRISQTEEDIANGPYNASLRVQLGLLENIIDLQRQQEDTIINTHRAQLELADQTIFHADRANLKVLEFLASQRSVTDVIADARISVIQSTYDVIDRGLDRFTKKLGAIGSVLKDVLSGFIRLALNKAFQMMFGGQTGGGSFFGGGGQQAAGGSSGVGGIISGVINGLGGGGFGGGGGGSSIIDLGGGSIFTPGASGTRPRIFGGLSAPASSTNQQSAIAQIAALARGDVTGTAATSSRGGGLFGAAGGLGALATMLPFLGGGLGASLGGGSALGTGLGIAGGALGGLLGIAMAPTAIGGLGAGFAGLGALGLGALAAAPALLIGAWLLSRNAARRRDEKTRNTISNDTGTAIWDLIGQAQRGEVTVSQARTVWTQIEQQYKSQIATLKDSKTRRNAELQWQNDFSPLWAKVEQNAREQQEKKAAASIFESAFVPTFAGGGLVPFFGARSTLIKVRPGERIDDVGLMRSWMVPGHDTGRDSVLTMASPGSAVRTREQQSIPGFANGSGGGLPEVRISEMNITIDAAGMVKSVMRSPDGRKITVDTIRVHIDKEGVEGIAGDLDPRRKR